MNNTEHIVELRVRYEETDQMGVVYYSKYLVWFEIARTELFRSAGLNYSELETQDNVYLPVVEAYCRYRYPLRYDDVFQVNVRLEEMRKKRLYFSYEIRSDNRLKATGRTGHVFIDKGGNSVPIPDKVLDRFRD